MTREAAAPAPPQGFVLSESRGGFQLHNGPLFHRIFADDPTRMDRALFIEPKHANALGVLHGGMLSAFLDAALGGAVIRSSGQPALTVHLSVDFLRMARCGAWLIAEARMTHATRDVAFAEGHAAVGGHVVGRASGVFKLMGRPD